MKAKATPYFDKGRRAAQWPRLVGSHRDLDGGVWHIEHAPGREGSEVNALDTHLLLRNHRWVLQQR